MKISAKVDYGCRALLELALHWPSTEPMAINVISEKQHIPLKFLTQIMISLKQSGFVNSSRGKSGGYLLAKRPNDVTLGELYRNLSGNQSYSAQERNYPYENHVLGTVWEQINEKVLNRLDSINFELLINQKLELDKIMTFEI